MNIGKLFLPLLIISLLFSCVACSANNTSTDPTENFYDTVTVSLPKTVYSLSEDTEIRANIVADIDEENGQEIMLCNYPNVEKYENGEWIPYHNHNYDSLPTFWPEALVTIGAPPGWSIVHFSPVSVAVAITDIDPVMTPGHYRMVVYLADSHTYYLEFDLTE